MAIKVVDGIPRGAHKTTECVNQAFETDKTIIHLANNYEQAYDLVDKHYNGDYRYGVDATGIVMPQGKERASRACSESCDHEPPEGGQYNRMRHIAQNEVYSNQSITPENFEEYDFCAYYATKFAVEFANVVIAVPQLVGRLKEQLDDYVVIIDEESTQSYFRPSSAHLADIRESEATFGPQVHVDEHIWRRSIAGIRQRELNRIDELERVPKRYRNIVRATDALLEKFDEIEAFFEENPTADLEDIAMYFEDQELPHVELEGSERERTATFERLRMNYQRWAGTQLVEAVFFDPAFGLQPSGDRLKMLALPDPTTDFVIHRDFFDNADDIWLVGGREAEDLAIKIDESYRGVHDPDRQVEHEYNELEASDEFTDNLNVITVGGVDIDESYRRAWFTKLANALTEHDTGHAMFAGSGLRAQQVHESTEPESYFFSAGATREHYQHAIDGGWVVTSYPSSRISRGIDLPSDVTIVRSTDFASGIWDYASLKSDVDGETAHRCRLMAEYSKQVEIVNMALRGSGQGEPHVAVVPDTTGGLYDEWFDAVELHISFDDHDLDDSWVEDRHDPDISDIVTEILAYVDDVDPSDDMYYCDDCETYFVELREFLQHDCRVDDT